MGDSQSMRSKLLFAMKILARVAVFFAILFAILFALSGITNWVTSQEGKTDRHMRDYIYTYLGEQKKKQHRCIRRRGQRDHGQLLPDPGL